jgi:hypothetical protein
MGQRARFADALLSSYVDIIGSESGMQFAALTIQLDDGTAFVAYRGTDNSVAGWREDFTMSFQVVPAQRHALQYLQSAQERLREPIRVGGHSKGGNLALYAAANVRTTTQQRILAIYNNDSPGLSPDVADETALLHLRDRITTIVPEFAVIGLLSSTTIHIVW